FVQRLPVREALARMMNCRLHVYVRSVDQLNHRLELGVRKVRLETSPFRERTYAYGTAIGRYNRYCLTDVLRCCTVHHDAGTRFKPVDRHVRGDDESTAAQACHRCLERSK